MENIISLIYCAIGFLLALFWWNKKYKKEYADLKRRGEDTEEGMYTLILLFSLLFWPIILANDILTAIIDKNKK